MAKIDVNNLYFEYGGRKNAPPVLRGLDLQIQEGEFVCLIGQSGCGKSTLLNILAGLLPGTGGSVLVDGHPLPGRRRESCVVFQHDSLFPWMTAYKNVTFGVRQMRRGLSKQEVAEIAEENLRRVGMWECRDYYPHQLSGGMQQRTAIARALATDADIMLLDEPFGALDAGMRGELQRLLKRLWEAEGRKKTALFVTHDIGEAVLMGDRVLFMKDGVVALERKTTADPGEDERALRSLFDKEQVRHARFDKEADRNFLIGRERETIFFPDEKQRWMG